MSAPILTQASKLAQLIAAMPRDTCESQHHVEVLVAAVLDLLQDATDGTDCPQEIQEAADSIRATHRLAREAA